MFSLFGSVVKKSKKWKMISNKELRIIMNETLVLQKVLEIIS